MISIAFAADQLERLMGMTGFPRGKESERYILEVRSAIQSAKTEAAAAQTVTDILRNHKRFPSVSDIYEAIGEENSRCGPPERQQEPVYGCKRCQDFGYFGGHLPPHLYAGPWKWCDCHAAVEYRDAEPGLVDEANRVRQLLIDRFASATYRGAKRKIGPDPMTPLVDEIYSGEF